MIREPERGLPRRDARPSLANGWRAFAHRNYQLFFFGQLTSLIGTWMQQVAQAWLVLQLTGDPFLLGVVAAMQFLPVMILGLFGGLIADALPKRPTLITTQVVQMVLAFVLFGLTVTGAVEVWHIIVLASLLGVTNAVDMPTRQSFVVEMVGRGDVANAVALNSAVFNGARIVGPAVAGLTIGAFDISVAFLVNGFSFLAVIVAYALMRENELASPPEFNRPHTVREVGRTLAEGLRYVRRTDLVLLATVVVGLVSLFGMNFSVIIPALAQDVLHTDATGYGFLMAASGIGSLLAALSIAFSRRPTPAMIARGALLLGLAEIAAASVHVFPLALLAMGFVGFGAITMAATANTMIQLAVPDELRGRVMSVYTTVFVGSTPFGGLLMGWIASRFGVDVSLAIAGTACALLGLLAFWWLRRIPAPTGLREATAPIAPA
ncbi:MAG: MFS transporter [Candidatus Limnocylindrales bacterium]